MQNHETEKNILFSCCSSSHAISCWLELPDSPTTFLLSLPKVCAFDTNSPPSWVLIESCSTATAACVKLMIFSPRSGKFLEIWLWQEMRN